MLDLIYCDYFRYYILYFEFLSTDKEVDDTLEIFARDIFICQSGWSFLAAGRYHCLKKGILEIKLEHMCGNKLYIILLFTHMKLKFHYGLKKI